MGYEFSHAGLTARREDDYVNVYDENEDCIASCLNWTQAIEIIDRFTVGSTSELPMKADR